jgi:hypothetical protein
MDTTALHSGFLASTIKLFLYYKSLGEKAMEQLEEEQLFLISNENSNSIAVIVNHLSGNMLSRWTGFLNSDGEKPWRDRDSEFENIIKNKEELLKKWHSGWECLIQALKELSPDDLNKIVYIRNEGHTVYEAILRQLAHYAYHVGQIIYAAKLLKTGNWKSLSIPKNDSENYNRKKFEGGKEDRFFTDKV